jgi:non-ribosomal peptide synthetase component F
LTKAVRDLAVRQSTTLFSTLWTAFQIALAKWAGVDDFVVGTPVANRGRESVRQTMGYFAGVVPLRGQVDRSRRFSDQVRAVHEATVDAFAHTMPFAELVRALGGGGDDGGHAVFDVRFALQNHPSPDVVLPRISTRLRMRSTGTARFDLGCEITEIGSELEVVWLFRPAMFPRSEVAALDRLFQTVLTNVCRSPDDRAAALTP